MELKHIEEIERFFEGLMSEEERTAFEARLLLDNELQEDLELYKKVVESMHSLSGNDLRKKMNILDLEMGAANKPRYPNRSNRGYKSYLAIAATLVFILLSSYFVFFHSSIDSRIAQYEIPEPGLPVLMGESNQRNLDEVMNAYKLGKFELAQTLLSTMLRSDSDNDTLNYFSGCVYVRLHDYQKASNCFEKVKDPNSVYFAKSQFESGLLYWRENDIAKAIAKFQMVSQLNAGNYSTNSIEILEFLR
ncbi:MAG: hypothetical protein IPO49_13375 [Bacteroidetes bacterium]|nr:hypothetical protein [Bacteroidota bacterium]